MEERREKKTKERRKRRLRRAERKRGGMEGRRGGRRKRARPYAPLLSVEKRTFFEKHVRSERWRLSTGVKPVAKAFDPLSPPPHLLSFHHGFLSTLHPPPAPSPRSSAHGQRFSNSLPSLLHEWTAPRETLLIFLTVFGIKSFQRKLTVHLPLSMNFHDRRDNIFFILQRIIYY